MSLHIYSLGERIGLYDDLGEELDWAQKTERFEEKQAVTARALDDLKEIFDELSW